MQVKQAMVFAAGFGTRLKPITDTKPKALVEFSGITLLEYAIRKLKFYGITDIIINVHHFSEQIIDFVRKNDFGVSITISDESSELLNTGGGLVQAKDFFKSDNPFIVLNVDIISNINLEALVQFHLSNNALATLAVMDRKTSRYLISNDSNELVGWENISSGERIIAKSSAVSTSLAFSGIQVLHPSIFNEITETGKFSITDMYLRLAEYNKICLYNHSDDFWLDVGKFDQIDSVNDKLAQAQLEFLS